MVDRRNIIGALPLVADALGRRYGVKVFISGQRAYTNGKDIHIPSLPLDANETILNLARGYLDHESAHLRITDFGVFQAAGLTDTEKHVWNIIEDYMVERKLAEIYPGCRHNFIWLIKHLFLTETDASEPEEISPASDIFNWLLLSLRALSVPELEKERAKLARSMDNNYAGLRPKLAEVVQSIPATCLTTGDCIAAARKIVEILKNYAANQPQPRDMESQSSTGNGNGASGSGGNNGAHAGSERAGSEETKEAGDSSGKPENDDVSAKPVKQTDISTSGLASENQGAENTDDASGILQKILDGASAVPIQDIGAMTARMLEGMCRNETNPRLSVAIPRPYQGGSLSGNEVAQIRETTTALRTRLSALLQAKVLIRNSIGCSGRIETRRIARLAAGDARIFARHGVKEGISTAIHILLDASASMRSGDKIMLACHACYAIADALQNIHGVGVAVTSFPNGLYTHDEKDQPNWSTVASILVHKRKIHPKFKIAANGGTPMAEAVWWVMQQMCPLKEDRQLLLIISDGEPDSMMEAITAVNACRAHGIEVYGIGIQTCAMRKLLPESSVHAIYDLAELAPAMFELLRDKLIKKKGGINESAA